MKDVPFPEYCYFDTAIGNVNRRNNVIRIDQLVIPKRAPEAYSSMFRFSEDYYNHWKTTGSVKGVSHLACYSDYVWFDIDSDDLQTALVNARQLGTNIERIDPGISDHLVIFFSGAKGFHIGIPALLFGIEPAADLPQIVKRIAETLAQEVSIDTSIYEKNRLWRVPNTLNSKSRLFKVQLRLDQLFSDDVEAIRQFAKKPFGRPFLCLPENPRLRSNSKLHATYLKARDVSLTDENEADRSAHRSGKGWLSQALRELKEGNRNTTFARIIGFFHSQRLEPMDIQSLLEPHAEKSDFPFEELKREIDGICQRYSIPDSVSVSSPIYSKEKETERRELKSVELLEFLANHQTKIPWCVDGILPAEGIAILAGPAGVGKSLLLLELAIAFATGEKWLREFPTSKGRVLYFDEESSPQLLSHRFKRLLVGRGIEAEPPDIQLVVGQGLCLSDQSSIDQLFDLSNALRPSLIIIDSLIRVHTADENSATEMARVFAVVKKLVRVTGCSIVIADHVRKPGQLDRIHGLQLRGSSEKQAFVDSILILHRKHETLTVEHFKLRHAEPVPDFEVNIQDCSPDSVSIVFAGYTGTVRPAAKLKPVDKFLDINIPSGEWISRGELLELAKKLQISTKTLDKGLKLMCEKRRINREDRKTYPGRGRKRAFYQKNVRTQKAGVLSKERSHAESRNMNQPLRLG